MTVVVYKKMTDYAKNQEKHKIIRCSGSLTDHLGGFLIIGCITTCIDISFLWVLTDLFVIWYLVSAGLSFSMCALLSFFLNKLCNYKNTSQEYLKQASSFLIISTTSLIINLIIISLCVEIWSINYLVAKCIATAIAFLWNYFGQSIVTFRFWQ